MRSKSIGEAGLARCMTTSTGPGTQRYELTSCSTKVKPASTEQLLDVGDRAGDEVVDRDDLVTAVEQRPAQV